MKVSFVITSYNYEDYIEKCILSCLEQKNFEDFEVLVVDDGSKDNTIEILKKYSNKIRYFLNKNQGIEIASNFGINQAKGEFIVRVDADDMICDNYLENVYPYIGDYDFIYTEYCLINENEQIIAQKSLPDFDEEEIKMRGDFLATGTMYRKSVLEAVNFYNTECKNCGLENYELILNLLKKGFSGKCIHKPCFLYRQHGGNISVTRRENIIDYGNKLVKKFNLVSYNTNENHPWGLKL